MCALSLPFPSPFPFTFASLFPPNATLADAPPPPQILTSADFEEAHKGFTPLSLRDVKLEKSETAWADIGGLGDTKRILRETLEWPTKYAAIFKQSPLRLRSGYDTLTLSLLDMSHQPGIVSYCTAIQDVGKRCWRALSRANAGSTSSASRARRC